MEINTTLVKQLISAQFPQYANLPVRPVKFSGWDNRTFHLGNDFSVRLPSHQRYAAQVKKEQQWLPYLAMHLPLPIPTPIGLGEPSEAYPYPWSIYRWLEGENSTLEKINDVQVFAETLALFLKKLYAVDASNGPVAGAHNFYRGGSLTVYHEETLETIRLLGAHVDGLLAQAIWQEGLQSCWTKSPVWVHGDISASNLLLNDGNLSAVIDFGCMGVGDPACDLTIAWTLFNQEGRDAFRTAVNLDEGTWARSRSWAIWKALLVFNGSINSDPEKASAAKRVIQAVTEDHLQK